MRISYSDISLNINKPKDYNESFLNMFFLHGFTGSSNDWEPILPGIDNRINKFTIDLIGHGKSDSPNDPSLYGWEMQVEHLHTVINSFTSEKVVLLGYSMGGRLALCYAHKYPERLLGLILESSSPGIKDDKQREKRIKEDEELALFIASHPIEEFVDLWVNREIFGTLLRFSDAKRKDIKKRKMGNSRTGLSNSLIGFGTGKMPPLYQELRRLKMKTLLMTGDLDSKFTDINKKIVRGFPSAVHRIIKNSGHTIHLEEPVKFTAAVNEFLAGLKA